MIIEKIRERMECKRIAFQYRDQKITFQQLYHTLACNQKFLTDKGYSNKEVIYIQADNQFTFVICLLSSFALGSFVIPIHKSIKAAEVQKIISLTDARCLTEEEVHECIRIKEESQTELIIPHPDKYGVYHTTSGSSGLPKICVRTASNLYMESISFAQTFSLCERDEALSLCPLEHSFAFGAALMSGVVNGFTLHIIDEFKPRSALRYLEQNHISLLFMVPAMARMLCLAELKNGTRLFCLRIPLVGAGPITKELYFNFMEKFGVRLLSNFGSTETGSIISRTDPYNYESVGKAMYGVDLKICDESGKIIPDGEQGCLFIKSKSMLQNYLNHNIMFDEDHYISLGDLAVRDANGNIYIKGRKDQLINIGGKKVNPIEVEKAILEISEVEECKVYSVQLKSGEQIMKAYIVGKGIKKQNIFNHLKENLSEYKIPSIIEYVPAIERNVMGKVRKESLK